MTHSNIFKQIGQMVSLACFLMRLADGIPTGEASGSNTIHVESSTDGKAYQAYIGRSSDGKANQTLN